MLLTTLLTQPLARTEYWSVKETALTCHNFVYYVKTAFLR